MSGRDRGVPVWIDLPGAHRDHLLEVCRQQALPGETASYWLRRCRGPRVVLYPDSILVACHAALVAEEELFVAYPVRMFARPDLVLTTHGSRRGRSVSLQLLLPGLSGAIAGGARAFGSALLREVAASYGRVLDRILDRASPFLASGGSARSLGEVLPERLPLFLRRLREQRSLLVLLRGSRGSRFFAGGYGFIDELMATLVSAEIGAAAIADSCGRERRARKLPEVRDGCADRRSAKAQGVNHDL